ncbi:acyl-CoA-binding domain-containing protein 4 isoform X1 [Arapaima gigas]
MPPDSRTLRARPLLTTPGAAMTQPEGECERRFRAAVDVIQSLPKNGVYRPSYEVMLRFYGLYKQAVFGPCRSSRPGFWDPVGRYKWDAWSRLGEMSSAAAMTEYVEEMKKVAQEVIDNMPVDERTASLFHYFEPLYLVIHDMPRPPAALLNLRAGELGSRDEAVLGQEERMDKSSVPGSRVTSKVGVSTCLFTNCLLSVEFHSKVLVSFCTAEPVPPEGLVGTSDSESDVFCDSVEQLDQKAGAGQGGEGAGEGWAPPAGARRRFGQDGLRGETREPTCQRHAVCLGGRAQGGTRRARDGVSGDGGGDGWEGGSAEKQWEAHVQLQVVSTLRQLQEDMRSVMERLEAVERLAAAQVSPAFTHPPPYACTFHRGACSNTLFF